MAFQNTTMFIVPIQLVELTAFSRKIKKNGKWILLSKEEYSTDYMLHYVHRMTQNPMLFQAFQLRDPSALNVYMYHDRLEYVDQVTIEDVRLFAFGTDIAFMVFYVTYGELTLDQIQTFAYRFKKSSPNREWYRVENRMTLYETVRSLLPENTVPFFDSTADFKRECHCFHCLKYVGELQTAQQYLYAFRRTYDGKFESDRTQDTDLNGMLYEPYSYDRWAGSQEALVNLVMTTDSLPTNAYIDNMKMKQLQKDYLFMYLLLLNQSYSAKLYVDRIVQNNETIVADDRFLRQVAELKTTYSFRTVSDDALYQNIYSRMYEVLNIAGLLSDVQDSEMTLKEFADRREAKTERQISTALIGLTVLSVFSAVVDAASAFDRFGLSPQASTMWALIVVATVVVGGAMYLLKK